MTTETYAVIMHQNGEILAEGELDTSELEELIRKYAPKPINEQPGTIIVRAVLAGGSIAIDGWKLGLRKLK